MQTAYGTSDLADADATRGAFLAFEAGDDDVGSLPGEFVVFVRGEGDSAQDLGGLGIDDEQFEVRAPLADSGDEGPVRAGLGRAGGVFVLGGQGRARAGHRSGGGAAAATGGGTGPGGGWHGRAVQSMVVERIRDAQYGFIRAEVPIVIFPG